MLFIGTAFFSCVAFFCLTSNPSVFYFNVSSASAKASTATSVVGAVSQKLVRLAKKLRMNSDVRRSIFYVIMSSEVRELSVDVSLSPPLEACLLIAKLLLLTKALCNDN